MILHVPKFCFTVTKMLNEAAYVIFDALSTDEKALI